MHALSSNIEFASTFVIICASMTRWVARKISEKYNYVKVCGISCIEGLLVESSASKSSIRRFVIMEKAPTRASSWLKLKAAMLNRS